MARQTLLPLILLLSAACGSAKGPGDPEPDPLQGLDPDADGDGIPASRDCDEADATVGVAFEAWNDADGDGFGGGEPDLVCALGARQVTRAGDCDDTSAAVWPGAPEVCDGQDNDCDGGADDGDPEGPTNPEVASWVDADGDGSGALGSPELSCILPEGRASEAGDCEDGDPSVGPHIDDLPYDGIDADCAGNDDYDADGDGVVPTGMAGLSTRSGELGLGGDLPEGDCNDTDPGVSPLQSDDAYDALDTDCGGEDDFDADGDGVVPDAYRGLTTRQGVGAPLFGGDAPGGDCNDADPNVFSGQTEALYDGLDGDCGGEDDFDGDGDGYVPEAYIGRSTDQGVGSPTFGGTSPGGDCADSDPTRNPGAQEVCGGGDEDCDGWIDEADSSLDPASLLVSYSDLDGDGYGPDASRTETCTVAADRVRNGGDCADLSPTIHPGADERCGGADEDCDGLEGDADPSTLYTSAERAFLDVDGDGFGNPLSGMNRCVLNLGEVRDSTDCDDSRAAVNPNGQEVCSAFDEDCDGLWEEADPDLDLSSRLTFWTDLDGDGFGDETSPVLACNVSSGTVDPRLQPFADCVDSDSLIYPTATEVCDGGTDQDCDGLADDADPGLDLASASSHFRDVDGDGAGDPSRSTLRCAPNGDWVADPTDCDDADSSRHPAATERCDSVDNDCDGLTDDADPDRLASTGGRFYADTDNDGFGDSSTSTQSCALPSGYAELDGDCADTDAAIFPGADEVCDEQDNDCDGLSDDADPGVDLSTGTRFYPDQDEDGAGDTGDLGDLFCELPDGYADLPDDCDDADDTVHPAATEVRDALDNDCDGTTDEGLIISEELLITELFFRPAASVGDANGEWIELYNPGSLDVVIDSAWRFRDESGTYSVPAGDSYVVSAGRYLLLVRNDDASTNGGIPTSTSVEGLSGPLPLIEVGSSVAFHNTSDQVQVEVSNPDDPAAGWFSVDSLTYNAGSPWPTAVIAGTGLQLSYTSGFGYLSDNSLGGSWCKSSTTWGTVISNRGTPGAHNLSCSP